MRSAFNLKLETLLEVLQEIGLNNEQLESAEAYLESGEEALLKDIKEIDFSKIKGTQQKKLNEFYYHFKKSGREQQYARYFHLLFTMGTCTVASIIPSYEFSDYKIFQDSYLSLLRPEEFVTIYAEHWMGYNSYDQFIETIIKKMRSSKEPIDELFEKIEHYHEHHCKCRAMLPLYCAYFLIKEQDCGEEDLSSNEKFAEFLKSYEECILHFLKNLVKGKGNEDEDFKVLNEFAKKKQEDATLSPEVSLLIKKCSINESSFRTPIGCAFLNRNISHACYNFVNICFHINLNTCFSILDRFVCLTPRYAREKRDNKKFLQVFLQISEQFSIDISKAIYWYAGENNPYNSNHNILKYCAEKYNYFYMKCLKNANVQIYANMFAALREVKKEQAEQILEDLRKNGKNLKEQYIKELLGEKKGLCYQDLREFLYGKKGIDVLELHKDKFYENGISFYGNICKAFDDYLAIFGMDDIMKRILAYDCFVGSATSSSYALNGIFRRICRNDNDYNNLGEKQIEEFFAIVDSVGLSILCQINTMGTCYDVSNYKVELVLPVLSKYLETRKEEMMLALEKANVSGRMLVISALGTSPKDYKEELLNAFSDTSKAVKNCLIEAISKEESFRENVIEKLGSKKATEREIAVSILSHWRKEEDIKALELALEKEKSSKVSTLILEALGKKAEGQEEQDITSLDGFVKNITKGNRKKTLAWAFETPFSIVHNQDGKEVDDTYMMALLLCYSSMDIPGVSKDALALAEVLQPQELSHFMKELFAKWVERGAESKKKWVLYASSIHGGAELVAEFQHYINEWPKMSRGAIAAEAVKALALNNSPSALLVVDSISRKFKFRQVKNAAGEALDFAAKQLGITKEELADKIVPDLGFNESMERIFDYGERKFKVYINQALEIEVYDEKNKKLKNLPAPGKRDDEIKAKAAYEEFKLMKKQMKTTVTTQKMRLELALSSERKWKCEDWKNLFIKNPIMHQFAISLIWGVYKEEMLTDTFRYMEDGSFNTAEEEEYELLPDCLIGLVHPIELTEEQKNTWKEQLEDYEIVQSIEQLDRNVYSITEEEVTMKYLERFGGKVINDLSFIGKLSSMGWYRGSVLDAGGFFEYYREDAALGLGVELHFSGTYVGGQNEDITIYHAIFYKIRYENDKDGKMNWAVERGSYIYDEIKEEAIVPLNEVPKRYFSEIVYQLTKATASSTEVDTDWKKEAYPQK